MEDRNTDHKMILVRIETCLKIHGGKEQSQKLEERRLGENETDWNNE